jgi:two-component system chemotaxis response regulator CheY
VRTCLVVDESRVIRKVARRIIEDMGFDVGEAADGAEALAWCRGAMPDAILLEWNLPVIDGVNFVRQLRKEPSGAAPVVVFCTGRNSIAEINEALEAGADEYMMKPFDADILKAKFAEAGL